jgi:hypothetical protein
VNRLSLTARRSRAVLLCATVVAAGGAMLGARTARWGDHGHEISGRAAATRLPANMPAFFRAATDQLTYLNPEPDRWRGERHRELAEAVRYDHYIDFEIIPPAALEAGDRWQYVAALAAAGIAHPPRDAGLLPFHIVELYQRLLVEWGLWRNQRDPAKRRWIEQRIINDAGTLGHYVTDGANPHHTTIHFDGWAEGYPNPRGFTTRRGFHARFESAFVETHVVIGELLPHITARPRALDDVRAEVLAYLQRSHARVTRLYELDLAEPFGPATRSAAHEEFAIERLVAGANMLRDLWWTAWVRSGEEERLHTGG